MLTFTVKLVNIIHYYHLMLISLVQPTMTCDCELCAGSVTLLYESLSHSSFTWAAHKRRKGCTLSVGLVRNIHARSTEASVGYLYFECRLDVLLFWWNLKCHASSLPCCMSLERCSVRAGELARRPVSLHFSQPNREAYLQNTKLKENGQEAKACFILPATSRTANFHTNAQEMQERQMKSNTLLLPRPSEPRQASFPKLRQWSTTDRLAASKPSGLFA